jgi:hypothetical protein
VVEVEVAVPAPVAEVPVPRAADCRRTQSHPSPASG